MRDFWPGNMSDCTSAELDVEVARNEQLDFGRSKESQRLLKSAVRSECISGAV